MQNPKTNTILLIVLIILVLGIGFVLINKNSNKNEVSMNDDWKKYPLDETPGYPCEIDGSKCPPEVKDTYTYTNHGFSIEFPKGFVPQEIESETLPTFSIMLPNEKGWLIYIHDVNLWEKNNKLTLDQMGYSKEQKIGGTVFKTSYEGDTTHYFRRGNIAYMFTGAEEDIKQYMETFKFVGWSQVEGNKEDLVSFSIKPGQEVSGKMTATGSLKGAYFFEGNIPVYVFDAEKKFAYPPNQGYATATTEWMTPDPVLFKADFDFTSMPKGRAYIGIMQNDPSGGESGKQIKTIFIPIVIK